MSLRQSRELYFKALCLTLLRKSGPQNEWKRCLLDLKIKPFSLVLKIKGNLGSMETRALKELQCGHALVHVTFPCMSHVLV